ncbi:uncharacterized protein LOC107408513 [Ziziphus jujuba]|uniref:Large ribosomal subunit protein uL29m n=1 Tax=Ziziphus jujuba TaxID=326968 RepID=A0ABM4A150_ZIZJJ|nr:uncharacterized protein LOC107408513 [Ziziphus jujuba]
MGEISIDHDKKPVLGLENKIEESRVLISSLWVISWARPGRVIWAEECWKASELRLKSWDDLSKLWYVLSKEKNMLMTQRQMLHAQNLRFPNPERIPKVSKSMCRIKHVLTEKAIEESDPRRSAEMKRMINAF